MLQSEINANMYTDFGVWERGLSLGALPELAVSHVDAELLRLWDERHGHLTLKRTHTHTHSIYCRYSPITLSISISLNDVNVIEHNSPFNCFIHHLGYSLSDWGAFSLRNLLPLVQFMPASITTCRFNPQNQICTIILSFLWFLHYLTTSHCACNYPGESLGVKRNSLIPL